MPRRPSFTVCRLPQASRLFRRATLLLVLCGSFAAAPAHAQQVQRNLLASRYTLADVEKSLVSHADWKPYPRTPAEWQAAVPAEGLAALVKAGEETINFKWQPISATLSLDYVRTGDRVRHSNVSFPKRDALLKLVVAESIEGKGRFLEPILNGLWSICEESYWGVPAHIGKSGLPDFENPVVDLFSAETATLVALTDYFVGPELDRANKLFRKRIYDETNRRIFTPMLTHGDEYGWMSKTAPVNNWNPWINSNWIASTLFLEKNPARRAQMIHRAMLGLDRYLNSLGDDGGCDEGPGYWNAAGASTFDCLDLLARATRGKVTLFQEPLIRNIGAYIYKAHIAGSYYINFADAAPKTNPDGVMVYRFGQAVGDPQLAQFGLWLAQNSQREYLVAGGQKFRRLDNLLMLSRLPKEKSTYQPVHEAWLSDVQVLTARNDRGLFLGTHGGHNAESHNHNDVGDFVVYADGEPVIIDAGSGTYTSKTFSSHRYELWYTQSNYHNLPTINGVGEAAGRQYAARAVSTRIAPDVAALTMDIAPAYPKQADVKEWTRTVTLLRPQNAVEVVDHYTLGAPARSLTQSFMTVAKVDASAPGKVVFHSGAKTFVTLTYDASSWTVTVERPSQEGPDYGGIAHKWDGRAVQRVLLTHRAPAASGELRYRFDKQ